jgi:glycosyltransferase involved in cell wall biosynthesis
LLGVRILLVAHGFPRQPDDPAYGFLLGLARGQQALGHELLVVAPHTAGVPGRDTVGGVPVARYRYGTDAAETLAYAGNMHEQVLRSWPARWRLVRFLAAQRLAVRRAVTAFRPDVVNVHWWFPGGLAVWPLGQHGRALVLTSHGTDLFLLDRFRAARALAAPIFRSAHEVTVISSPLVDRVAALGVDRERITVVPMPLDSQVFGAPPTATRDPGLLLFVGRLIERKGAEYALRAVALLAGAGKPVELAIAGEGPARPELDQLARSLGLGSRVRFLGAVPSDEIARLYGRAAVFLMPSVTDWKGEQEGFGMVLVEAMRCGTPIVATRSGGIPDVVRDGVTGLLVPERDPAALAAAVTRILDDPALAAKFAAAARRDVDERFSSAAIARTFDAVFRRAAGTH